MTAAHQGGRRRAVTVLIVAGLGFVLMAEAPPAANDSSTIEKARQTDAILDYILTSNPNAPVDRLRTYATELPATAQAFEIDHCLALAQAEVESTFFPDKRGAAGEVGLYQILPSTASLLDRRLSELTDPQVNTEVALAYLQSILGRRPALRDALAEYNGGPRNRSPYYALTVLETYARVLRHRGLECAPDRNPVFAAPTHVVPTRVNRASYSVR
jgi:soluble lytic murein transglycosylase-like protein